MRIAHWGPGSHEAHVFCPHPQIPATSFAHGWTWLGPGTFPDSLLSSTHLTFPTHLSKLTRSPPAWLHTQLPECPFLSSHPIRCPLLQAAALISFHTPAPSRQVSGSTPFYSPDYTPPSIYVITGGLVSHPTYLRAYFIFVLASSPNLD